MDRSSQTSSSDSYLRPDILPSSNVRNVLTWELIFWSHGSTFTVWIISLVQWNLITDTRNPTGLFKAWNSSFNTNILNERKDILPGVDVFMDQHHSNWSFTCGMGAAKRWQTWTLCRKLHDPATVIWITEDSGRSCSTQFSFILNKLKMEHEIKEPKFFKQYEGISKSFRTEYITKYKLTFGTARWEAT